MLSQDPTLQSYFVAVRDNLIARHGDHMVASTIFAKRLRTICEGFHREVKPEDCAAIAGIGVDFAGDENYE